MNKQSRSHNVWNCIWHWSHYTYIYIGLWAIERFFLFCLSKRMHVCFFGNNNVKLIYHFFLCWNVKPSYHSTSIMYQLMRCTSTESIHKSLYEQTLSISISSSLYIYISRRKKFFVNNKNTELVRECRKSAYFKRSNRYTKRTMTLCILFMVVIFYATLHFVM